MADPMNPQRLEEFIANAPEVERGKLWSLLDWSFWGAGMADTFREPLTDTMLAAIPADVRAQAEAIMADFIKRREITKTGVDVYQEQREKVERLRDELEAFKPQPMSQRCRDGHHNGVGDEACINCHCLCHSRDAEVERLRKRWESSQRHANELIDRAERAEYEVERLAKELDMQGRLRRANQQQRRDLVTSHHAIGHTVDLWLRGDLAADGAMAEIHELVGDETGRTTERDAEETR